MRKPRTRAERAEAEYKARALFFRRVALLGGWDDAWQFGYFGPKSGEPGGQLYTNLVHYMRSGAAPFGAKDDERAVYAALANRLGPLAPRGF